MTPLYGHDAEVAALVASLIPRVGADGFGPCSAIGAVNAGGRIVGGFVYHNYDPGSGVIEFSGASVDPRWLNRTTLRAFFGYPFNQLGCQMVVTRNSATNTHLHRQLRQLSFMAYPVPRLFGRDEDAVIWTLTREGWSDSRFMQEKAHGQESPPSARAA